jgi:hypothetical protein
LHTPARRALVVINSTIGVLFRVNPQSGRAIKVDLGGTSLTAGDGLLVRGRTLDVVRNQLQQVAVIKLNRARNPPEGDQKRQGAGRAQ